jgi:hypothetical protein
LIEKNFLSKNALSEDGLLTIMLIVFYVSPLRVIENVVDPTLIPLIAIVLPYDCATMTDVDDRLNLMAPFFVD